MYFTQSQHGGKQTAHKLWLLSNSPKIWWGLLSSHWWSWAETSVLHWWLKSELIQTDWRTSQVSLTADWGSQVTGFSVMKRCSCEDSAHLTGNSDSSSGYRCVCVNSHQWVLRAEMCDDRKGVCHWRLSSGTAGFRKRKLQTLISVFDVSQPERKGWQCAHLTCRHHLSERRKKINLDMFNITHRKCVLFNFPAHFTPQSDLRSVI